MASGSAARPAESAATPHRRVVYRVVTGPQTSRADFVSDRDAGRRYARRLTPQAIRRREGFSVWLTFEGAAGVARQYGQYFGYYVAEVELPAAARLEPFPDSQFHATAYGDPDDFARSVVSVVLAR